MPKRKRDSDNGEGSPVATPSAKNQRVQFKLKAGTAKLAHAFKIAKGFERQKLGRRRKSAIKENKDTDIVRIDAEIAALKSLDNSTCATSHFHKTLSKIKAIASVIELPTDVQRPKAWDAAALNVHGRLCNSNPVKDALPDVLKDVSRALGVKLDDDKMAKKKRVRKSDHEGAEVEAKRASGTSQRKAVRQLSPDDEMSSDRGATAAIEALRRASVDDGDSENKFGGFDSRLASSDSDENAISESGEELDEGSDDNDIDVAALEAKLASEGVRQKRSKRAPFAYDHARDMDITSESNQSDSDIAEPSKAAAAPRPTKSSFLPSLSMGGYISGSDGSEASDIDEAPRKNRPGQRARQQIWEKKYGQRAKHLQNQSRMEGWDAKRGATDGGDRRGSKPRGQMPFKAIGGARTNAPLAPGGDKQKPAQHRDDSGPIHPSWQAARLAKERKESAPAFQGKKITFD